MATETQKYDYIIAGGGTAGSVLAARLSEDPSISVLLLEAGKSDSHPLIHVPIGFAKLTAGPFQWGFVSAPQEHAKNREIPLAQGRVLGGGGSINAQVFTRGAREDYDNWEKNHGAAGWGSEEMMRYFIKSEDNQRLWKVPRQWWSLGRLGPRQSSPNDTRLGSSWPTNGASI